MNWVGWSNPLKVNNPYDDSVSERYIDVQLSDDEEDDSRQGGNEIITKIKEALQDNRDKDGTSYNVAVIQGAMNDYAKNFEVTDDEVTDDNVMYINANNFDDSDNPRDGNCLFHALVKILKIHNKELEGISADAVVYSDMIKEQQLMRNAILKQLAKDKNVDAGASAEYDAEIVQVKKERGWGGILSIEAFSKLYNICIFVNSEYFNNKNKWKVIKPYNNDNDNDKCEFVAFLKHTVSHYINAVPNKEITVEENNDATQVTQLPKDADGVTIEHKQAIIKSIDDFQVLVKPEIEKKMRNKYNETNYLIVQILNSDVLQNINETEKQLYTNDLVKFIDRLNEIRYSTINLEQYENYQKLDTELKNFLDKLKNSNTAAIITTNKKKNTSDPGSGLVAHPVVVTSSTRYVPTRFKSIDKVGKTLGDNSGKSFFIHPESTRYNNITKFTENAAVYSFGKNPKHEQKEVTLGGKSKKRGRRKKDLAKTRKRKTPRKQKGGTIKPYTDFGTAFGDLKKMLNEKDDLVNKDIVDLLTLSQKCDALRVFFSNYNDYKADEAIMQSIPESVDSDETTTIADTVYSAEEKKDINHFEPGDNYDEFILESDDE